MTEHRIDQIARALALRLNRRLLAAGLAATVLGGGVHGAAAAPAAARNRCRVDGSACTRGSQCCVGQCATGRDIPRRQRHRCGCYPGVLCNGACADITTDPDHCGGCAIACDPAVADTCTDGACTCGDGPACTGGRPCDDGVCLCLADSDCAGGASGACNPDGLCLSCVPATGSDFCAVTLDGDVRSMGGFQWYASSVTGTNACTTDAECQAGCGDGNDCMCALAFGYQNVITGPASSGDWTSVPVGMGACTRLR
jgi:hypothetical protein